MKLKLKYVLPDGAVIPAGPTKFEDHWYADWLEGMVSSCPEVIFFLTTETTDIWEHEEPEIDYNEVRVLREIRPHEVSFGTGPNHESLFIPLADKEPE